MYENRRFDRTTRAGVAALWLVTAMLTGCSIVDAAEEKTPKAVFIIVDGIPADVIEAVATPNLDGISGQAGYARAYVGGEVGGDTESPTISAVGYNSLLTGTWANKHNVWGNSIKDPNYAYWDIFRIAKEDNPSLQTAIFSTWTDNRTKLIGNGLEAAGGEKLDYHFDGLELDTEQFPHDGEGEYIGRIDAAVAEDAARYIGENGPDLSWVYLEHTDGVAHRLGDSQEQHDAVQLADEQVGAIWKAIRNRQDTQNEDWLLVVTTDHGRDPSTGRSHGRQSERERTIWIVTNSDRLNDRFHEFPGIVDILPSIIAHLQIDMPRSIGEQLDGQSFID